VPRYVKWRILNLWSLRGCLFQKNFPVLPKISAILRCFYRAGLLKGEWGQLANWAAAGDGTQ
jgi:hypothetical protein